MSKGERLLYFNSVQNARLSSWAPAHPLARVFTGLRRYSSLQCPDHLKMSAKQNFRKRYFGPARNLWNSSVLTTKSYNITGLHVINVRFPLQGLRSSRFSSSATEVVIREFYGWCRLFLGSWYLLSIFSGGCLATSSRIFVGADSCPYTYLILKWYWQICSREFRRSKSS